MHNFKESLKKSMQDQQWFHRFYYSMWPDCRLETITNIDEQKTGIDTRIHFINGRSHGAEEKFRPINKKYSAGEDLCLEYLSSKEHNTPGWIVKKQQANLLLYGWEELNTCLCMDYKQLQDQFAFNGEQWKKDHRIVIAPNQGYKTLSVAVPLAVILPHVKHRWLV